MFAIEFSQLYQEIQISFVQHFGKSCSKTFSVNIYSKQADDSEIFGKVSSFQQVIHITEVREEEINKINM